MTGGAGGAGRAGKAEAQARAVEALAARRGYGSVARAVIASGRSRATIYRWLQDPAFRARLAERRAQVDAAQQAAMQEWLGNMPAAPFPVSLPLAERRRLEALSTARGVAVEELASRALVAGLGVLDSAPGARSS